MLTGNLLIRSYEQSERVYKAMRLRGYGQSRQVAPAPATTSPWFSPLALHNWVLTGAVLVAAVGLVFAEMRLA